VIIIRIKPSGVNSKRKMTYTARYLVVDDVYQRTGLTSREVNLNTNLDIVEDSETEADFITGKKWDSANSITEYFNGPSKDMIGISGQYATFINLTNYPVQSITSFSILNSDMTTNKSYGALTSVQIAAGTYYTTDYILETMVDPLTHSTITTGKITLINDIFPTGKSNIKVAYTYGYSSVPTAIRNLSSCLAGIRMWIRFLGGGYNRLNSYSIPQQTAEKGDFYDRGMKNIQMLTEEAERLLDRIGKRQRRLFFASGSNTER
jgi:hypothetical protein